MPAAQARSPHPSERHTSSGRARPRASWLETNPADGGQPTDVFNMRQCSVEYESPSRMEEIDSGTHVVAGRMLGRWAAGAFRSA
jgi:hypothetical protein